MSTASSCRASIGAGIGEDRVGRVRVTATASADVKNRIVSGLVERDGGFDSVVDAAMDDREWKSK